MTADGTHTDDTTHTVNQWRPLDDLKRSTLEVMRAQLERREAGIRELEAKLSDERHDAFRLRTSIMELEGTL